jgi:magnesium chelatase subunit I
VTETPSLTPPADLPRTVGELRASGHRHRTVKQELRDNLLARLADGSARFPGVVGYDDTVLPELERALLAGHDLVLLGERGQGKSRVMRSLVTLLDEWTPVIPGSELNEHPFAPITAAARRAAAEAGEDLRIAWLHRSMRYGEKLATPDTSVGDLIGDVDPIRAAPSATRRPSTSGSSPVPIGASSPSTSCPTWPSASRSRCSTCWRSATSRSGATSCGCRSTCC